MGSRGATFIDATVKRPCRVCGATRRCCEARDGRTVICFRSDVWGGRPGRRLQAGPRSIGDRWSWYVGPHDGLRATPIERVPEPSRERASDDDCDRVYRALLEQLELAEDHLVALTAPYPSGRAFPVAEVRRRGYRTLRQGRARVARELLRSFGADVLARVPGLYLHEPGESGQPYWSIAGGSGLLIPVRDSAGRIVGAQIRQDDPGEGQRYVWLSSTRHGGPSSGTPPHVPFRSLDRLDIRTVRITEGPLKGDAATVLDPEHLMTLAFPGADTWSRVLPELARLQIQTVRVAFDADVRTNPNVARAFRDCVAELARLGYRRELELWTEPKGIDDLFASGGRPEVVADEEAA